MCDKHADNIIPESGIHAGEGSSTVCSLQDATAERAHVKRGSGRGVCKDCVDSWKRRDQRRPQSATVSALVERIETLKSIEDRRIEGIDYDGSYGSSVRRTQAIVYGHPTTSAIRSFK